MNLQAFASCSAFVVTLALSLGTARAVDVDTNLMPSLTRPTKAANIAHLSGDREAGRQAPSDRETACQHVCS